MCVILYNNIPHEIAIFKWNTPFSDTHSPFSSTTRSSSEGIFKVSTAVSPQKGTAELDSFPSLKCVRILSSYLRSKTHTKQLLGGFKRCRFSSSSFSDDSMIHFFLEIRLDMFGCLCWRYWNYQAALWSHLFLFQVPLHLRRWQQPPVGHAAPWGRTVVQEDGRRCEIFELSRSQQGQICRKHRYRYSMVYPPVIQHCYWKCPI